MGIRTKWWPIEAFVGRYCAPSLVPLGRVSVGAFGPSAALQRHQPSILAASRTAFGTLQRACLLLQMQIKELESTKSFDINYFQEFDADLKKFDADLKKVQ